MSSNHRHYTLRFRHSCDKFYQNRSGKLNKRIHLDLWGSTLFHLLSSPRYWSRLISPLIGLWWLLRVGIEFEIILTSFKFVQGSHSREFSCSSEDERSGKVQIPLLSSWRWWRWSPDQQWWWWWWWWSPEQWWCWWWWLLWWGWWRPTCSSLP